MTRRLPSSPVTLAAAASPAPPTRAPVRRRPSETTRLPLLLPLLLPMLLLGVLLGACASAPEPTGDLREIMDEHHRIADPGIIGASATGRGCAISRQEALTKAQRVAQFNLRSLTGSARYKVRFDLVDQIETASGFCVELSAIALEPRPFVR